MPRWLVPWIGVLCLIQGVVNWLAFERLATAERRIEVLEQRR